MNWQSFEKIIPDEIQTVYKKRVTQSPVLQKDENRDVNTRKKIRRKQPSLKRPVIINTKIFWVK